MNNYATTNGSAPQIVCLNALEGIRMDPEFQQAKLIKVTLPSIREAKNRAIVLALLTLDVRRSSEKFIRLFTKNNFVGEVSRRTYRLMRESLRLYNLEDRDT